MANKKDPYGPKIIYRFGPFRIVRIIERLSQDESEVHVLLEKNVGLDAMGNQIWINQSGQSLSLDFNKIDWDEIELVIKAIQSSRKEKIK